MFAAVGILGLALVTGFLLKRAAPPAGEAAAKPDEETSVEVAPVEVRVATAVLGPVESTVAAPGTVVAGQGGVARVAPLTAGRLTRVLVREGERVSPGQLVAVVDAGPLRAQAQSARAALSQAQAQTRSADLSTRATQSDTSNAIAQARLALQTAQTERIGAERQATLDLESAHSDYAKVQAQTGVQDSGNGITTAQLGVKAARLERDASVQTAQNALRQAETGAAKLRAGSRPQEIAQADLGVQQAQATRDRAQTEVKRVQFLYDKGIRARRDLDDAQTALQVAETALSSARSQAALLREGTRQEDVQAAELQVQAARETLTQNQKSGDAKVAQAQAALRAAQLAARQSRALRPQDLKSAALRIQAAREALNQARKSGDAKVAQARAALSQARSGALQIAVKAQDARAAQAQALQKSADLQAAQTQAQAGQLRAPLGGIVSKRLLNVGDMADPTTPILEISDPRALNLVVNLPPEEGARLRPGLAARLSSDIAPGRVLKGVVSSVGAVDAASNLQTARIAVSGAGLPLGASAQAQIVVRAASLRVLVPRQAVITRDEKPTVFVVGKDGAAHQKTVVVGAAQGEKLEIVKGLKPGERVVVQGQYELEDGAKVVATH